MGGRWFRAGVSAAGERKFSVAEEQRGGAAAYSTAVSVAEGGAERGTAKGAQGSMRAKHRLIKLQGQLDGQMSLLFHEA